MTRDNTLYLVIGVLAGFISGYLMHEVMAARQPPRLVASQPNAVPGAAPAAGTATPSGGGPPMEEIIRLRDHVAANPEDADSILLLANLNYDIRRWDRAGELYLQYLDLRPESPDVLTDLGVTYRERSQFGEALNTFRRAQELADDHWQSVYNEVVVHAFDLKDFAAARSALERLRVLQPANPEIDRLAQEVERRATLPTT